MSSRSSIPQPRSNRFVCHGEFRCLAQFFVDVVPKPSTFAERADEPRNGPALTPPDKGEAVLRPIAILACCVVAASSARGDESISQNDYATAYYGGLIIGGQRGQSVVSLGGAIFRRRVNVITATPDGPVATKFTLPSPFHTPNTPPSPFLAPATIRMDVPASDGIIYIEGALIRTHGTTRYFESPPLSPGTSYSLQIRSAYRSGDRVLIEDRQVTVRAGALTTVSFDGTRAYSVPAE